MTCDVPFRSFNSATSSCDPTMVGQQLETAQETCFALNKPANPANFHCKNCAQESQFLLGLDVCSSRGQRVKYFDWRVKTTFRNESKDEVVFIEVSISNDTDCLPDDYWYSRNVLEDAQQLSDFKVKYLKNESFIGIQNETSTNQFYIRIEGVFEENKANFSLLFEIENSNSAEANIFFQNSTEKYILIHKKQAFQVDMVKNDSSNSDDLTTKKSTQTQEGLARNRTNETISQGAYIEQKVLMESAGLVLIGSLCSFALPTALIKLFQIIELMGKFYFIPVHFSPTMTISSFSHSVSLTLSTSLLPSSSIFPEKMSGLLTEK